VLVGGGGGGGGGGVDRLAHNLTSMKIRRTGGAQNIDRVS